MALCAMAVAAGVAQAKTEPPEWMVSGADVTLAKPLAAELKATLENNDASLLTVVGENKVPIKILCTAASLRETKMLPHGELTHGRIHFTGCKTFLNGSSTASAPCEPYTEEGGTKFAGLILTNKGKGHLALHTGGVQTVVIEPANLTGEPVGVFVNILLGPKGECGFGENVPVEGKLVIVDCEGKGEIEQVTHLISESTALHLLTSLGSPATLDGSANATLAGTHEGRLWSGLAG